MTPRLPCCRAWDAAIERAMAIVRGKPDAEYIEALRGRCTHGRDGAFDDDADARCNAHDGERVGRT